MGIFNKKVPILRKLGTPFKSITEPKATGTTKIPAAFLFVEMEEIIGLSSVNSG